MVKNIFKYSEKLRTLQVNCTSKGNYRKVSCVGEHNTQGTSSLWVNKQGAYRICL